MTKSISSEKNPTQPLWRPSAEVVAGSNMTQFMQQVQARWSVKFDNYWGLDRWALENPEKFWTQIWEFGDVIAETRGDVVLEQGDRMPGAKWFPQARLNFAENLLRRGDDGTALVFWGEDKVKRRQTYRELYDQVSRLAQALRAQGVETGDRVVGFMPNMPESVIAMLAATSVGAVWSSCSPDFGVQGVLDRFGQVEPKVLISADGYHYNGKTHDCLARLAEIESKLPTLKKVLVVPYLSERPDLSGLKNAVHLADFVAPYRPATIEFKRLPFAHPLYIMFSSGTTGVPKCIVHCAGGVLLQHLKEHLLHTDIHPNDRLFYYTTCGWMMWNWLVSGLAAGATLLLYDGSPFYPSGNILFDYADAENMTVFGTSAKYIEALAKKGIVPMTSHRLSGLKAMLSTGSPLVPEDFDYVYDKIKQDLQLSSISGGTDIISCFVLGNPLLPVWRGEIQCRGLALAVDILDDSANPVRQEKGELVCTKPFPVMPVGFWNDPEGKKYRAAYFEKFANIWCHGDYAEMTEHNGFVIYGRSDAVLNPGGVRIGTAEIYRQVEQLDEVVESIVIGQDWENDVRVVLFVRLRDDLSLNDELDKKIKAYIRKNTTPRHVPAKILQVTDIPRTKSGKIVELAVREVVHGRPVKNKEALANPEALEHFRNRSELQS
ncbi:MAG: acetoacetate--CoA ligase [Gammaproteobacteria bacterium]|nr:acetoacetate--CoA ligase [Gammaproteobacteria bacterium]